MLAIRQTAKGSRPPHLPAFPRLVIPPALELPMAMGQLIWSALNELAHSAFHSSRRELEIVFHHVCESAGRVQLPKQVFTFSFQPTNLQLVRVLASLI